MYYVWSNGPTSDVFGVLGRHFVSKAEILVCSKMNVKHDAYGPYRVVRTHATHRQTHTHAGALISTNRVAPARTRQIWKICGGRPRLAKETAAALAALWSTDVKLKLRRRLHAICMHACMHARGGVSLVTVACGLSPEHPAANGNPAAVHLFSAVPGCKLHLVASGSGLRLELPEHSTRIYWLSSADDI